MPNVEDGDVKAVYAVLSWEDDSGESDKDLADNSTYVSRMNSLDPQKYYFQYRVWEDSFKTYLIARSLASQKGLSAGWIIYKKEEAVIVKIWPENLGGGGGGGVGPQID